MSTILEQADAMRNGDYTYKYGGNGSDGTIDCSHLVNQALRGAGYDVPYENTAALSRSKYYEVIDPSDVRPGDIALWRGRQNHVGIVDEYNSNNKTGSFIGSQSSTGPARAAFGDPDGYWGRPTAFLRPLPSTYKGPACLPPYYQDDPLRRLYKDNNRPSGACNGGYTSSRTATPPPPPRRDPLVLDLDGDGIETVGIDAANPILFDHAGAGVQIATGWLKADDAFLVFDRSGNGTIDSGAELFSDATPLVAGGTAADGFAALAQEDSNNDGVVDANDADWASLKLWRDLNQDGISQVNELSSLADQHIAALRLARTVQNVAQPNGNRLADTGTYVRDDASTGTMGDIDLVTNPFISRFTDPIVLMDAALDLADMQGAGMVRSLREAASLDEALVADIQALDGTTRADMLARLDTLLGHWAGTSAMKTSTEDAEAKGYRLVYLPQGMSVADY